MADQTTRCLFVLKRVRFLRLKRPGAAYGAAREQPPNHEEEPANFSGFTPRERSATQ